MRRYKITLHPTYDQVYDKGKKDSTILNDLNLFDKKDVESAILTLKGDDTGKFYAPEAGEYRFATIRLCEAKFEVIKKEFEKYQITQVNEGKAKPTEVPLEMKEKQLTAEAELDVYRDELVFLEKKLASFVDKEVKANDDMLKYGTQGHSKLLNSVIVEVDGQTVGRSEKGVLCITSKQSPYYGLATSDYFEFVARPWLKERDKIREEQREKRRKKEITQEQYRPNIRPTLIPFPSDCKNHLKNEK